MTAEVDWVLEQLVSVVDAQPNAHPLKRVDRDNSTILEDSVRKIKNDLQEANFVGARWADRVRSPIGTEYDYDVENVVGLRIAGLHHSEWGHIDPDGSNGVSFDSLVDDILSAIDDNATYPDVTGANGSYTHLLITNEAPQSTDFADFYRFDADVVFSGYEER